MPGNEHRKFRMVRRRSTVRFRKGAPSSKAKSEQMIESTGGEIDHPAVGALHVRGLVRFRMITPMVAFVGTSGRAAGLCGTPRAARLADHHRLDAVLARLQERAGQIDIAVQHYTRGDPCA